VSLADRELGLIIASEHRSFAMSKRLGDWINRRFHTVIKGTRRGVADPKTDRYIELQVPPLYRHNLGRYIRVVQCVAVIEPAEGRHARMQLLARQLADPVTAPAAALRLEAIGKDAIPALRQALESGDAEIRFAAAEALAYLAEAARSLRSARPAALAALSVLDDANGIDALEELLTSRSSETRYGAFRALQRLDPGMPLVRGERLGDACRLHVLDVDGPPLIHSTRRERPELVFFGPEHPVSRGLRAEAGRSIVVVVDGPMATVSRFVPGQSDQAAEVPAEAAAIVRAIIDLGGGYPDAVQFLQRAAAGRHLASRLAFDALPDAFDGRPAIHEETGTRAGEDAADTGAAQSREERTDERS
jgi:HEAT repeat protein